MWLKPVLESPAWDDRSGGQAMHEGFHPEPECGTDEQVITALKIRVSGVQFPPWPLQSADRSHSK
jgi:hypothetical protein